MAQHVVQGAQQGSQLCGLGLRTTISPWTRSPPLPTPALTGLPLGAGAGWCPLCLLLLPKLYTGLCH